MHVTHVATHDLSAAVHRMADLMSVKDRMVSDERCQREALESKLKRICAKVKTTRGQLDPQPLVFGGKAQQNR